ncbi:MAG: hypothetical protein RDU25_03645 [Patescibacteria group bacterium]|nr:hypothetical protein [Patescibacteria group bacterium]
MAEKLDKKEHVDFREHSVREEQRESEYIEGIALNREAAQIDDETRRKKIEQLKSSIKQDSAKKDDEVIPVPAVRLSWWRELSRKPIFRAGLVAFGLHAPLIPDVGRSLSSTQPDVSEEVREQWEMPDQILRPQSERERSKVGERVRERLERRDEKALERFKQDARNKFEQGETLSFGDLYFNLEKINGVDDERVEKARRKAEKMAQKILSQIGDDLEEDEIRDVVKGMFRNDDDYDWGQGSVTEYFLTNKRNCFSITGAELIVFELVIKGLPHEQQERFVLGKNKIQQHEYAVLLDKETEDTYRLEPPLVVIPGADSAAESIGTVYAESAKLKEALVAEKPIQLKAAADKKRDVRQGPRIDFVVNQPVDDGIVVEGKLRSSDYVLRQSVRQGLRPIARDEYEKTYHTLEFELLIGDPGADEAQKRLKKISNPYNHQTLDATDFYSPSRESVRALNSSPAAPILVGQYLFGRVDGWSEDSLEEMLRLRGVELAISTDEEGNLSENFLSSLQKNASRKRQGMDGYAYYFQTLRINTPPDPVARDIPLHIPLNQLRRVLSAVSLQNKVNPLRWQRGVSLSYDNLSVDEAEIIAESGIRRVYVNVFRLDPDGEKALEILARRGVVVYAKVISDQGMLSLNVDVSNGNLMPNPEYMTLQEVEQFVAYLGMNSQGEPEKFGPFLEVVRKFRDVRAGSYDKSAVIRGGGSGPEPEMEIIWRWWKLTSQKRGASAEQ